MAKRTLVPWGRNVPQSTMPKVKRPSGSSTKRPTPDASLFSISYPPNKPYLWPIEGGKTQSPGAVSDAAAEKNNAAVDYAFVRAGYAPAAPKVVVPQQPAQQAPPTPPSGNTGAVPPPPAQQQVAPPPPDNTQQAPPLSDAGATGGNGATGGTGGTGGNTGDTGATGP